MENWPIYPFYVERAVFDASRHEYHAAFVDNIFFLFHPESYLPAHIMWIPAAEAISL
jgi:hypothetical protein